MPGPEPGRQWCARRFGMALAPLAGTSSSYVYVFR
jgi:hypothetical protein